MDIPSSGKPPRILLMDDESSVLRVSSLMLRAHGCYPVCCASGREAVEKFRNGFDSGERFDLAILDIKMPDGQGATSILSMLRSIDPDAKIIVCSGNPHDPVMQDPTGAGFTAALPKPYSGETLRDIVRAVTRATG